VQQNEKPFSSPKLQKKPFNQISASPLNQTDGLDRCLIKRLTKISMLNKCCQSSTGLRYFPAQNETVVLAFEME